MVLVKESEWFSVQSEPDEEIVVHPGDDSKVCELEDSVHDPHHFVGQPNPRGEYRHQQWNVRSALVVW